MLNEEKTTATMKIDCHMHTSDLSSCAVSTSEEQIKAAIKRGLDAVILTEHDRLFPLDKIEEYNKKYAPFKVYQGIEVRIVEKEPDAEDILVIGIHDKILEEKKWKYKDLHKFVEEKGGFLVLAHPYRYRDYVAVDIENYKPHAVELYSSNLTEKGAEERIALSEKLGSNLIINSDSHHVDNSGLYYNELNRVPKDEKELVEMLKNGEYKSFAIK